MSVIRPLMSREEGAIKLIVPLDPESVRKLIGRITDFIKNAKNVEEVGENYVVIRVPRLIGSRRARLDFKIYETDETVILVAKGRTDSLILAVDIIDTGEGSHIVVSGGGAGGAAKIASDIVKYVAEGIARKIEGTSPKIDLVDADNKLAALEVPLPASTTLVYYDSFTPIRNVAFEAAQRLMALLGYDDYLAEVSDYSGRYLLRMVLRGNRITGLYAEVEGDKFTGDRVLSIAVRPPSYRVRIKAWSLTGSSEAYLYEPEKLFDDNGHQVYWIGGAARLEYGGLAANTYVVVSGYEAAIIDPSGGERLLRAIRNVVADLDEVRYILLSSAEADAMEALDALVARAKKASIAAPAYWVAVLAAYITAPGQLQPLPTREVSLQLGDSKLLVIPSRARGAPTLTIYDERSRTLFTGVTLGAVSPPGLWNMYVDDIDTYEEMVRSYVLHTADKTALKEWLERITTLDIEAIAPKHGPIVRGRNMVERILSTIAKW
ncbi:MBL fold metallo-hydrolase [Hyperthermus butylicus]|uniref:Metallo-beta-lactamase domain-containing protein n=1 Tax=Hyperthermus butylicus (strain DSM 5456 / JCM 9403 / PLM1-5) TaxID=415426 RepID=A2BJG3_HYPBU|nr:MBL fold metallo-hydrolase [Hyperthermus butylicus]ABM80124.1 hypothetical protein Hbut_0252 [Hyperthermus butylicus DSM 5456]